MTNDEATMLMKGRVPMHVVIEALKDYRRKSDRELTEDLTAISSSSGVPYDTLETYWIQPERFRSVDFGAADRIFCACHVADWWWSEYSEYYNAVNLNLRRCAHPACIVYFEVPEQKCTLEDCDEPHMARGLCHKHHERARYGAVKQAAAEGRTVISVMDELYPKIGHGAQAARKEYCSQACASSAGQARRGGVAKPRRLRTYKPGERCQKGHEWTADNTIWLKSGKRKCRTCNNARSQAGYHRRKVAA